MIIDLGEFVKKLAQKDESGQKLATEHDLTKGYFLKTNMDPLMVHQEGTFAQRSIFDELESPEVVYAIKTLIQRTKKTKRVHGMQAFFSHNQGIMYHPFSHIGGKSEVYMLDPNQNISYAHQATAQAKSALLRIKSNMPEEEAKKIDGEIERLVKEASMVELDLTASNKTTSHSMGNLNMEETFPILSIVVQSGKPIPSPVALQEMYAMRMYNHEKGKGEAPNPMVITIGGYDTSMRANKMSIVQYRTVVMEENPDFESDALSIGIAIDHLETDPHHSRMSGNRFNVKSSHWFS